MTRFLLSEHSSRSLHKAHGGLALAVALALVAWPTQPDAMSLGRSRGAAVLGRAMDVTALVSMESQEPTPEAGCFSAEVFYGETRISPQNVTITPVRTSPSELALRVRSSNLIDEPFVTLYLRITCSQNLARKYVLLADSPTEPASAAQSALPLTSSDTLSSARTPAGTPAAGTSKGSGVAAGSPRLRTPSDKNTDLEAKQARAAARAEKKAALAAEPALANKTASPSQAVLARKPAAPVAASPRLKVDLLDLTSAREPSLRASTELLTQPSSDPQARSVAAALWRAINKSPDDLVRDGVRLQSIEAEVRTMADVSKQQTQELTVLRSDLQQAKNARYANPFMIAMGALTLAALAFAVWAWRRRGDGSKAQPWWGNVHKFDEAEAVKQSNASLLQASSEDLGLPPKRKPVVPYGTSKSSSNPGVAFGAATALSPAGSAAFDTSAELAPNAAGASRSVNTEELFDIQQQADFFMSLGQHSQAIDILQNHISDNVGTSALAYLDLFDIYHKIGQREDFEALRDEFNRVFNAQVPQFDNYGSDSRGLEEYSAAIERIQALWPNPKVLSVIEESIFRSPELDAKPFDLLAYRELMLLYAIAKDVSLYDSQTDGLSAHGGMDPYMSERGAGMPSGNAPLSTSRRSGDDSSTLIQPLSAGFGDSSLFNVTLPGIKPSDMAAMRNAMPPAGAPSVDIDLEMFDNEAPSAVLPAGAESTKTARFHAKPGDSKSIDFDDNVSGHDLLPKNSL
jgi:pilus assembly protein FimV